MELNERTKRVMAWREYLELLPDEQFLDLMRTYLGAIRTPYNKHTLIESLSAFLRKPEVRKNLTALLSAQDIRILTAVSLIGSVTEQKLSEFFADDSLAPSLREHVRNLEERLVLFRHDRENTELLEINPLLDDALFPLLSAQNLFRAESVTSAQGHPAFFPDDLLVASFVGYVSEHPDCCKGDGHFKKKALADFESLYPSVDAPLLQKLCDAFCALGVFAQGEKWLSVDWERLSAFAALPSDSRCAYLCAAWCGHASRSELRFRATTVLSVLSSLPPQGLTKPALFQLLYLARERNGGAVPQGRFALLLQGVSEVPAQEDAASCIDACIALGLLFRKGTDSAGQDIYVVHPDMLPAQETAAPVLELDASGTVTVFPCRDLPSLVPLMQFLSPVRFDVAATYRLDRISAFRAFGMGQTDTSILSALRAYCRYDIPQSVQVSVEEWYAAYTSVSLYHGYVITVTEKMRPLVRNAPALRGHIVRELSSDVFLLDFASAEEASRALDRAGLGERSVSAPAATKTPRLGFSALVSECVLPAPSAQETDHADRALTQSEILSGWEEALSHVDTTSDQKEVLAERIRRRLVVSGSQLSPDCVRFERREAEGMDFAGKMHIIETALSRHELVEIEQGNGGRTICGQPVELLGKKTQDVRLSVLCDSGAQAEVSVGAISRIRRARKPLSFD